MTTATVTTSHLYVVLPTHEGDYPRVYTSILAGAPHATRDDISPKAAYAIGTANHADPDTTTCHRCSTPVGHHFVADTDPERFVNTGFYVAPDGTILCEECGDPDTPPAPTATTLPLALVADAIRAELRTNRRLARTDRGFVSGVFAARSVAIKIADRYRLDPTFDTDAWFTACGLGDDDPTPASKDSATS